ncbi:MAG: carbohydrate ABC transporter permease, partial [Spirochaetota bacterium]
NPMSTTLTPPRAGQRLLQTLSEHRTAYLFILPFTAAFVVFIVGPVLLAGVLAFTDFNALQFPQWVGWRNLRILFTQDIIFLRHVFPNTFIFATAVGVGGFILSITAAWAISYAPRRMRGYYMIAFYLPSIVGPVLTSIVWTVFFSPDRLGYLNNFLINLGVITEPQAWVQSPEYLMPIMIFVSMWSRMGVGFLAILAGMYNVDQQLYEAARLDGIRSRLQELWYITLPAMKPQLLFAAVMAIVTTLRGGGIGVQLSGRNPTPEYAGQLIENHMNDYGFIRMEMGYATALSFVLLVIMFLANRVAFRLFASSDE